MNSPGVGRGGLPRNTDSCTRSKVVVALSCSADTTTDDRQAQCAGVEVAIQTRLSRSLADDPYWLAINSSSSASCSTTSVPNASITMSMIVPWKTNGDW